MQRRGELMLSVQGMAMPVERAGGSRSGKMTENETDDDRSQSSGFLPGRPGAECFDWTALISWHLLQRRIFIRQPQDEVMSLM